jgi:AmmeMemoRadiSam system protein B/AmmeMemoRadiSam system protein A
MSEAAFSHVRTPAVADMFYPGQAQQLQGLVRRYLFEARSLAPDPAPKAIIAPHAGFIYSGPIAASAYVQLRCIAARVRRVVLIGPCHRVAVDGIAVPSADAFATPLGLVPVDRAAVAAVSLLPGVQEIDAAHRDEHALEVHLPFLQEMFSDFSIVPLLAGAATADAVADVLEALWGGDETVIVVSSDLSHYMDYAAARNFDAATCRAIETLDASAIDYDHACGRVPMAGLLALARRRGLRPVTLDLRSSGDTAGDRRRVVGYGAWMFVPHLPDAKHESADAAAAICRHHGATLLETASASIDHGLSHGEPMFIDAARHHSDLRSPGCSFVTLYLDGALRGCVGSAQPERPLISDVAVNGFAAAFHDRRFPKLTAAERERLAVSVSVLTVPQAMRFAGEDDLLAQLHPGEDGLIIRSGPHRGLFLPQVWSGLPLPHDFLAHLKVKAGLQRDAWPADLMAWRFSARSVSNGAG